MEKINIAELLKDCPQGMKLYSPIFGDVYLDKIRPHLAIVVTTDKEQGIFKEEFLYDGRYGMNGECILFPSKDQQDWNKFQRPFKNGDIIINESNGGICIFKKEGTEIGTNDFYCGVSYGGFIIKDNEDTESYFGYIKHFRLATEEEKQKFFDAIKDNGYKWNAETKTLEKLIEPKFKVGDIIKTKIKNSDYCHSSIVAEIRDDCFIIKTLDGFNHSYITDKLPFSKQDEWELVSDEIKPKFKVGDVIQTKDGYKVKITKVDIDDECYGYISKIVSGIGAIDFKDQDEWELVNNKFDISTLVPFESKVLVRHTKDSTWCGSFFSHIEKDFHTYCYKFVTTAGKSYPMMIPYENNEHLIGKDKDCDEFYKNWKE